MCTGVEIALVASSVLAAGGAVASGQQQKLKRSVFVKPVASRPLRLTLQWRLQALKRRRERRCALLQVSPEMQSRTRTRRFLTE